MLFKLMSMWSAGVDVAAAAPAPATAAAVAAAAAAAPAAAAAAAAPILPLLLQQPSMMPLLFSCPCHRSAIEPGFAIGFPCSNAGKEAAFFHSPSRIVSQLPALDRARLYQIVGNI